MSEPSVACLVVGIDGDSYQSDWGAGNLMRFAAADASRFYRYVRLAWPQAREERSICLLNKNATMGGITAAIETIASARSIDLLLVYLSGHGILVGNEEAAFCTADGTPTAIGIEQTVLSKLLAKVGANNTLVFADCCFAHRILGGCSFFGELNGTRARLYIASATGEERSWEDTRTGHGVFSDVLMGALETGDLATDFVEAIQPARSLAVGRDLVPFLRRNVPLAARRANSVNQQPVHGGSALDDIVLPAGVGGAPGRQPPTVLQALSRQFFRIARVGALIGLCTILVVQEMTYHITVNASGHISVGTGLATMRSIWPTGWAERVDTGIPQTSLPDDPVRLAVLFAASKQGVWTHINKQGYRRWIDSALPLLGDRDSERWHVLLDGEVPKQDASQRRDQGDVQIWQLLDVADAARLSQSSCPDHRIADIAVDVPDAKNVIDVTKLDLPTPDFLILCEATSSYIHINCDQMAPCLINLSNFAGYRLAQHEQCDSSEPNREFAAAADSCYVAFMSAESRRTQILNGFQQVLRGNDPARSFAAAYMLARLAAALNDEDALQVKSVLLHRVQSFSIETEGTALNLDQEIALSGLSLLAASHPLDIETFVALDDLTKTESAIENIPELGEFLVSVSSAQRLPTSLWERLVNRIKNPTDEEDFFVLTAMRALAENSRFQELGERTALFNSIDKVGIRMFVGPGGMMPDYATVLGIFGRNGVDLSAKIDVLVQQLDSRRRPAVPSRDYFIPGTVIEWSDMPFAVALADIARSQLLSDGLVGNLRLVAALRPLAPERRQLIEALAAQASMRSEPLNASAIRKNLAAHPDDAAQRSVDLDVILSRLEVLNSHDRATVADEVRQLWHKEREPEVRRCLGEVVLEVELKEPVR